MDYKTLFSQTPPTQLFFKAAIPGSIGMLASALYQVADGIFISRILGGTPPLPGSTWLCPWSSSTLPWRI